MLERSGEQPDVVLLKQHLPSVDGTYPHLLGAPFYGYRVMDPLIGDSIEIRREPGPPVTAEITGLPEFSIEDTLRGEFVGVSGHELVTVKHESMVLPQQTLILPPEIRDEATGQYLELIASSLPLRQQGPIIQQICDYSRGVLSQSVNGLSLRVRDDIPLCTITAGGKVLIDSAFTENTGEEWEDVHYFKRHLDTDPLNVEFTSTMLHVEDTGDTFYLISGLDFRSMYADDIFEGVREYYDGRNIDEEAVRDIFNPYIQIIPV